VRTEQRVAALRSVLADERVAAVLVSDPANVAYLTGFEGVFDAEDAHAVVVTESTTTIFTDGRYIEAIEGAASGTGWDVRLALHNLYESMCSFLTDTTAGPLAIEDSVPHARFTFVESHFDGEVRATSNLVERLRQVKEPAEVARIEAAQTLTDRSFAYVLDVIRPGATEREVALALEFFLRKEGSDGVAFPPIVASGPNSALPHATVTDREIEDGDLVILDFGARIDGYCADMTRTVAVGAVDDRQRSMYEAVLAANEAGVRALRPGILGKEADAQARSVLQERGYGELFTHGLGHGVGLEVHELPGVGPRSEGPLPEGCVVTVEPGIYERGRGGVRIEDLVVVEATGARVLTRSPRDLIEL
jgi:Xaa-Pro aminopeptidase